jgi:hypothetical protein
MRSAFERLPVVAVVHHDWDALIDLTVTLSRNGFAVTAIASSSLLDDARRALAGEPHAVVVALTGAEDAVATAQFATAAGGRAIFLAPRDSHAGYERLSNLLAADTSKALIVATLIALIAGRGVAI